MKHKYEDKAKLHYTDTDSCIFHIEAYDLYDDFNDIDTHMDFSGYENAQPNYDNNNNKALGKFKDEHDGNDIC